MPIKYNLIIQCILLYMNNWERKKQMVENEGTTNTNIKLMLLAASYDQTNLTKKEINKPTNCFYMYLISLEILQAKNRVLH